METFSVLRISLFKHSEESFIAALDEAGIPHGRVQMFSSSPQDSIVLEVISTMSEAMPWNAIANVVVAWVKSKGSREVMITSEDGSILHTKDCSASQVKKLLPSTVEIAVIDTQPSQTMQHNKALNAGQATEQIAP